MRRSGLAAAPASGPPPAGSPQRRVGWAQGSRCEGQAVDRDVALRCAAGPRLPPPHTRSSSALYAEVPSPWHACSSRVSRGDGLGEEIQQWIAQLSPLACCGQGLQRKLVARVDTPRQVPAVAFGGRPEASIVSLLLERRGACEERRRSPSCAVCSMDGRRDLVSIQRWCRYACLDAAATRVTLCRIMCSVAECVWQSRAR